MVDVAVNREELHRCFGGTAKHLDGFIEETPEVSHGFVALQYDVILSRGVFFESVDDTIPLVVVDHRSKEIVAILERDEPQTVDMRFISKQLH